MEYISLGHLCEQVGEILLRYFYTLVFLVRAIASAGTGCIGPVAQRWPEIRLLTLRPATTTLMTRLVAQRLRPVRRRQPPQRMHPLWDRVCSNILRIAGLVAKFISVCRWGCTLHSGENASAFGIKVEHIQPPHCRRPSTSSATGRIHCIGTADCRAISSMQCCFGKHARSCWVGV